MKLLTTHYLLLTKRGFTLIEGIVYVALFVLIFGALVNYALSLFTAFAKTAAQRETINNARTAMDAIVREIKYSKAVYQPASCFGIADAKLACAGGKRQLSLITSQNLPSDESQTYSDLYLDGDKVYIKREGAAAGALTSGKVRVTNLVFERLDNDGRESVRTTLTIEYDTASPKIQNSVTLYSTAALRGSY